MEQDVGSDWKEKGGEGGIYRQSTPVCQACTDITEVHYIQIKLNTMVFTRRPMGEEGLTPRERHGMGQMGEFYQLLFIIKEKKRSYHKERLSSKFKL
jgi:hypothetical protein